MLGMGSTLTGKIRLLQFLIPIIPLNLGHGLL